MSNYGDKSIREEPDDASISRARDAGLIARLNALLPQTQCRQCGYAGCRPYAEAIATGETGIDRCAPGGDEGASQIAAVMGVPAVPVNPRFGAQKAPAIAVIDESMCIGCTICIEICPVDAIVGAMKLMHTIIAGVCTGCELCVAPCPVDCIGLVPTGAQPSRDEQRIAADLARVRFERRAERLARRTRERTRPERLSLREVDQHIVQRAIQRAQARLAARGRPKK